MPCVRLHAICKLSAILGHLSGSRCWTSAPSSSSSFARRRPRRSPHGLLPAFLSRTYFYVTLSLSWGFFWLDLMAQAMGNGWRMGWTLVLEGCSVSEFPLPFFSLIFFLSCRFCLSMRSATSSVPLVKRGRPPHSSPFHSLSNPLIRSEDRRLLRCRSADLI